MNEIILRDFQEVSIGALKENIKRGIKNQLLSSATGSGKTVIAAHLLKECYKKGLRAIFCVDRISLVNQSSATLDFYGVPHGILQAQHWRFKPWERIQIASAATLARRGWPDADLIIVDECHSQVKDTIERISKRDTITIGLTATPFSKGLGKHYDAMVGVTTTNKLIKDKFLVPFRIFAASEPDMNGAKVVAGEWTENEAADRAMPIVGDCVAEYLKHGEGKKFIAFGCNVAHATELKKQFAEAGVMCELYTYKEGDEFRTETVDEFRKPDSYIRGLISVSALSKGFDCVEEGSLILTNKGYVTIEELSIDDTIWDGVEFVSHGGAIFKGIRHVITYQGLTATPDHLVSTKLGWKPFGYCAENKIEILADGRPDIQECFDNFKPSDLVRSENKQGGIFVSMLRLWNRIDNYIFDFKNPSMGWLSSVFGIEKNISLANQTVPWNAVQMREQKSQSFWKLWRERNSIQIQVSEKCCGMDSGKFRSERPGQEYANRPHRKQWSLRAWQSAVGHKIVKCLQYAARGLGGHVSQIQIGSSRNKICRQNIAESNFNGLHFGANHREVLQEVGQTKRRVWDILNCGPRNRFSCQGLLVHNCSDVEVIIMARPLKSSLAEHIQILGRGLRIHEGKKECLILDHAGNCLRFWDAMSEFFESGEITLDMGLKKQEKKQPPKDKTVTKCPVCHHIHQASACPSCGHVPVKKSGIEHTEGSLSEMGGTAAVSKEVKQDFYSQLLSYAQSKGYASGWVAHSYKNKFGVWPSGMVHVEKKISLDVSKWIRSQQIRNAKRKQHA